MSLSEKKVLITGGSRGIGRATALGFLARGADVAVLARSESALQELSDAAAALPGTLYNAACDLVDDDRLSQVLPQLLDDLGGLNVLVNNAGTMGNANMLTEQFVDEFEHVMALNVRAPMVVIQHCLSHLAAQEGAVVINVSSIGAQRPTPGAGLYWASKAALENLTKTMALEFAQAGVRAVAVAPGLIETDMGMPYVEYLQSQGAITTLSGEFGKPESIAETIMFLASDAASFINGATLVADGGALAMGPI